MVMMRSIGADVGSSSRTIPPRASRPTSTVRIETANRWDALDLAKALRTWRWYLVSQGVERWDVCVGVDARGRRAVRQLLETVQAWADRREASPVVHLRDGDVVVRPAPGAHAGPLPV